MAVYLLETLKNQLENRKNKAIVFSMALFLYIFL